MRYVAKTENKWPFLLVPQGAQIIIFDVQFIVKMKLFLEMVEIEIGVQQPHIFFFSHWIIMDHV